jgi:hypothetical protein
MKRLTLVLLAAFSLPATASINLNSSRSNAVDEPTTVKGSKSNGDNATEKHLKIRDLTSAPAESPTTVRGSKSNSSDRLTAPLLIDDPYPNDSAKGKGKLPGFERLNGKPTKDQKSIGDAVPDGCKPNEFCASGQHFPQPLKK